MGRKAILRWGVAMLSLGLVTSACTSDDGSEADNENEEPAPGRTTLEVVSVFEPPHLDPFESGHGSMVHVLSSMLMPILRTDDEGQLYSDVLESWETAEDGRNITLRVRPELEWNDGTPVTSEDVVMSLEQHLDPSLSSVATLLAGVVGVQGFADGEVDSISGLTASDDQTVVIELEEPNAAWLSTLATLPWVVVLPEHVLGDVPHDELMEHEYFKTFSVTNGPYSFVESLPGQHVELERNGDWSLGDAGFERLFIKWVEQTVAPAQLETGEVQYILNVDASDADRLRSIDGIEIQTAAGVSSLAWGLMYHEPLQDHRIRQAMAYAIDREGICESVHGGYCTAQTTNLPPIPEWATPSDGLTEYTYDPDRARRLLDEAGWDPNTELTFLNWQPDDKVNPIVQGNLADVGMNVTMENVDLPTLWERVESDADSFHAFHGGLGINLSIDPSGLSFFLSCDAFFPSNGRNMTRYCNEELDELFDAGRVETVPERRAEIYQDAFRILNEEVPVIPLVTADFIVAYDSHLKGVKAQGSYDNQLWNIGEWRWES